MLKKLLVAIIALSFIFALCSSAFAAKGTGQVKRLYQTLPNAPKSVSDAQIAGPTEPPTGTKFPAASQEVSGLTVPSHKPATCDWYDYTCGLAYYWTIPDAYGDDFFNMRFSPPPDMICTLKTLEAVFYGPNSSMTSGSGAEFYVWDDDGFGFPNSVVYSEVIPEANILYYPDVVDLDIYAQGIIFADDYHFGYSVVDQGTDVLACLSDDGSCGTNRSSENYAGVWGSMLGDWGLDVNFLMFVEACCYEPPDPGEVQCEYLDYTCGVAYYWTIPDAYGDDFFNMRFSPMPGAIECSLYTFDIVFYGPETSQSSGVDIYVWTDAAGYPDAVVHTQHVASGDMLFYPDVVSVDLTGAGLVFTGDYHCGYSTTDQVNDVVACLSDDGSCGTMRSSENYGGSWGLFIDDWGLDVNLLMFADQCCLLPETDQNCYNMNYAGPGYYFWTIPDAYGDDFFNMRFEGGDLCTLLTVNLAFYQAASVGAPGAEVYVWNSNGIYPTTMVTTFPINPVTVWYPGYESLDVSGAGLVFQGSDLHIGYTPIYNNPSDVLAITSDDGFSGTGVMQSSEEWAGVWGLMVDDWGIDVNFLINADVCCPPEGYCATFCAPEDQWPTFAHDYARTSQSKISVGDLCGLTCAWNFLGTSTINFASPIIADDMVFAAFSTELVALDLEDGSLIWRTSTHGDYAGIIAGIQTTPTYADGYLYFGAGSSKGFIKAEAATGNIVWSRSLLADPLPGSAGSTKFAINVVLGNEVIFGDDNGQIYALNATDGTDIDYATLNYGVYTSPSYADDFNMLLFGTSASTSGGAGGVYGIEPPSGGTFNQVWYWENPAQATVFSGVTSAPSYKCEEVYVGTTYPYGNFSTWSGTRHKLDPATGADLWASIYLHGSHLYAPPAVIGWVGDETTRIYFGQRIIESAGSAFGSGVRAVDVDNNTIWLNSAAGASDNKVSNHPTLTCDPYVIYGTLNTSTNGGKLYITNWDDGTLVASYDFTGFVLGTAVARHTVNGLPYIVTLVRHTDYLAGPGGVFAFTDDGIPKPKMVVPELFVDLGTVTADDQVTDTEAVTNVGCASLSGTAVVSTSDPVFNRRPTNTHPQLIRAAELAADQVIDYRIDDFVNSARKSAVMDLSLGVDEDGMIVRDAVKPTPARSSSLASSWAAFANGTDNFALAQGESQDFDFDLTVANMYKLLPSTFYVEISSNDPCYFPEDPAADPQEVITYQATYGYCQTETGTMFFGTEGEEFYTNYLDFGDSNIPNGFALHGGTGALFDGTMFFMTSMDDAAWTPATGGSGQAPAGFTYFYPYFIDGVADCGGCEHGIALTQVEYTDDGGFTYQNPVGDLCHFAAIDSLQGNSTALWPAEHQAGPSIGIEVNYREVGTYSIAAYPQFDNFKLVVFDITNRNATPITGLYYGNLSDWDVQDYADNKTDGDAVNGIVYCWDVDDPDYYGQIGLPRTGSYWPDLTPTDGYYNSRSSHNPTESYNDTALDELFNYVNDCPDNTHCYGPGAAPADPPDDQSTYIAFGKSDIPGNGSVSFGMAVFGLELPASPLADMNDLSIFVNEYAGFARGDVNNDGVFDLRDLVYLSNYIADPVNNPGPVPFMHLGDVDADGDVDIADVEYMEQYFFYYGPPPLSTFVF